MPFVIRDLDAATDMIALEDLQVRAWRFSDREVVPGSMLVVGAHTGGVVAAAFVAGDAAPAGFVYGFPALRDGRLSHHSHMLAVAPEHRGTGIAEALKRHQRDRVLAQGLTHMTWTMDPLLARNARLNLGKLGARATAYHADWYAARTGIYEGLPADRFMIDWDLRLEPAAKPVRAPEGELAVEARDGLAVRGPLEPRLNLDAARVLIEIPRDIDAVKTADLHAALAWRAATRRAFTHYFARGYAATDLRSERDRVYYLLERA